MSTAEPRDPEPAAPAGDAPPVDEPMPLEDESLAADPEAYDSPRAVQARARGLAAPYIAGGEDPDMARARREERRNLRILIAMVVVIVLSGFVLGALQKILEGALGGASAAPSAAVTSVPAGTTEPPSSSATGVPAATVAPEMSPVPGTLEDGVPTTLDGIEVIHGAALLAATASMSDDTVFLAGGWFHGVHAATFCPLQFGPKALWTCPVLALYIGPSTALGVNLAHGTGGLQSVNLSSEAYRPVVLRVHTHDSHCPMAETTCLDRLVLDEIAWLGESLAEPPTKPEESPPPPGFSRGDALARARRQIRSTFELTSVTIVRESESTPRAGAVAVDPWTWYLRFEEPDTGNKAWVVLDYMTGRLLDVLEQRS